jgi:hypothetical protein
MPSIGYIGFEIVQEGIRVDFDKLVVILYWSMLNNIIELQILLVLVNFYRPSVPRFSHLTWQFN